MSQTFAANKEAKPRLKFIDLARSCAIILMLEGHFTGAALSDAYRDSDKYWLYSLWHNLHGLTSPLFFTVTGLIFVYLLSANNSIPYNENVRVHKGFKRVSELLFWGYIIQFSLWAVIKAIYYGSEWHLDWFYAFHVLQSIGLGIFLLLIIYGIYKKINHGALYWYYLIGGIMMFTIYAFMKHHIHVQEELVASNLKASPDYIPKGAPSIIQNVFYGPFSDFSFIRYSGYVILGGMLGSIIRIKEKYVLNLRFALLFIGVGLLLNLFPQTTLSALDRLLFNLGWINNKVFILLATSFMRFGQVMIFLGILMLIDKNFNIKSGLFLKIGQNTLPIYVVHVIILYGGIFGIGLQPDLLDRNLGPWASIGISIGFILIFAFMVKYIEPLERIYSKIINRFKFHKPS